MATRASPAVGNGDHLPDPEVYLRALALELQMQAKVKALRDQHKKARKAIESSGVRLDDLKTMYALRESSDAEVEQWLRRKWSALSAAFGGLKTKFGDGLFDGYVDTSGVEQSYRHKGRMHGVAGEAAVPPKGITTDEVQWWMEGWNQGNDAHTAAKPVLADILAEALETADEGGVVDGTTTSDIGKKTRRKRSKAAQMVADQAAEDFRNDNPPGPTADEQAFGE